MSAFAGVFDQIYGYDATDNQHMARFYAFMMFVSLNIRIGQAPAIISLIDESSRELALAELYELFSDISIPDVAARLTRIPIMN